MDVLWKPMCFYFICRRNLTCAIAQFAFFLSFRYPLHHKRQLVSNSRHNAGIRIPGQERVLAVLGLGVFDVGPSAEEILVAEHLGQFARDGAVDVFHDGEIGREEDVEVALLDLRSG